MAGKRGKVVETVGRIAEPAARAQDLTLWDVQFVREGASWFLRLFIDKPGGVTLDDCERFHRAVDPLIDAADPIAQRYYLEVSSPGVGRPLRRPAHFQASIGKKVRVRLFQASPAAAGSGSGAGPGGGKEFTGRLESAGADSFVVALPDGKREIPYARAALVRLADDDDMIGGIESNE